MEERFALCFSFSVPLTAQAHCLGIGAAHSGLHPPLSMDTQDSSFTGMVAGQPALGDLVETPWRSLGYIKLRAEAVISLMVWI